MEGRKYLLLEKGQGMVLGEQLHGKGSPGAQVRTQSEGSENREENPVASGDQRRTFKQQGRPLAPLSPDTVSVGICKDGLPSAWVPKHLR